MSDRRLRACVLGSGSAGNCVALEGPDGIALIDAGFSPRETRRRMEACGLQPSAVRAVVLTHPDSDHLNPGWRKVVGGLAGPRLVVRARHAESVRWLGFEGAWIDAHSGGFEAAGIHFEPFPLPHDSLGSTAFRASVGDLHVAHATDCGRVTRGLAEFLGGADILLLESNYDPAMQRASGRPQRLIERITGGNGHLSNEEALGIALQVDRTQRLRALVLLHLSRDCNCPDLVRRLYAERAPALAGRLVVSSQHAPAPVLEAGPSLHLATLFGG